MHSILDLFENYPPMYCDKVELSFKTEDQKGEGRGMIASSDIDACSLLIVEQPVIQWTGVSLTVEMVQIINATYDSPEVEKSLKEALLKLHPIDFDKVSDGDKEYALEKMNSNLERARCLLAMEHNGLKTGLYLHIAMFNHSSIPNCVVINIEGKEQKWSEVWTTRKISKGEELFINYLYPSDLLHESASEILSRQHRFIPALPPVHLEDILSSFANKEEGIKFASETEKVIDALEDECIALEEEGKKSGLNDIQRKELTKKAEIIFDKAYEKYTQMKSILVETHKLNKRVFALLSMCAEFADSSSSTSPSNWGGEDNVPKSCMATCAALRFHLLELDYVESSWRGKEHREVATLCNSVSGALQRLLSKCSRVAIKKSFPGRKDFQEGGVNAIPLFEKNCRLRAEELRDRYSSVKIMDSPL